MSWQKIVGCLAIVALATGCAKSRTSAPVTPAAPVLDSDERRNQTDSTIWELFNRPDVEATVQVNRYLWFASLDVLNFLPVQTVDPFTGLIVTGYG